MLHYTLNTGHSRASPRAEVSDDIISMMRPMLVFGEHAIPSTNAYVMVTQGGARRGLLLAMVYTKTGGVHHNLATIGVCGQQDDDLAWDAMQRLYLGGTDKAPLAGCDLAPPKKPASVPWCAVMLDVGSAKDIEQMEWLGDFERCLAWTYLESLI